MSEEPGSTRFELRNRRTAAAAPPAPYDEGPVDADAPASEPPPETPEPRSGPASGGVGRSGWAVLAVAVVLLVLAFLAWRSAAGDPDRERAELRDTALIEGTAAVETMNTMDYRDVDAGLDAWRAVSTGVLHDQLVAIAPEDQQTLVDAGEIAVGRVVQAALVDLTDRTATLIAAVETTLEGQDGAASTVKRNRFAADLVRVGEHWKLENLQQVEVSR